MSDVHLDDAIDRAVREMMSVDAPEEVKARVLARLESSGWTVPWFRVAAVTSLAAAVLAAFVMVRSREPVIEPRRPEVAANPTVAGVPTLGPEVPPGEKARVAIDGSTRAPRTRVASAAAVDVEEPAAFEIDPLAAMVPIAITPIQQGSIAPANIAVEPLLPIVDLSVEPLPRAESGTDH